MRRSFWWVLAVLGLVVGGLWLRGRGSQVDGQDESVTEALEGGSGTMGEVAEPVEVGVEGGRLLQAAGEVGLESERVEAPGSAALSGARTSRGILLRDAQARALPGAELHAVRWFQGSVAQGDRGTPLEERDLLPLTVEGEEDGEGWARLAPLVLEDGDLGQALWAFEPGRQSALVVVGQQGVPEVPASLELGESVALRVQATVDGAPAPSSTHFEVHFEAPSLLPWNARSPAEHALVTFVARVAAEGRGPTPLPAPPAELGSGRVWVRAVAGDSLSPWRRLRSEESATLPLHRCFEVQGMVKGFAEALVLGPPRAAVRVEVGRMGAFELAAAATVRADGSFGPVAVPVVPEGRYRAWIDSSSLPPAELALERPEPGAMVELRFESTLSGALYASVRDAQGAMVDSGIVAHAHWSGPSGRQARRASTGLFERRDLILFPALPTDRAIELTVEVAGLGAARLTDLRVPRDSVLELVLTLQDARALSGMLVGGAPLPEEARLQIEDLSGTRSLDLPVELDAEGRFALAVAPPGELLVRALLPDGRCSPPVAVGADVTSGVELPLSGTERARGQVIVPDPVLPIVRFELGRVGLGGAWLALDSFVERSPAAPGEGGHFEFEVPQALEPSELRLRLSAPGWTPRSVAPQRDLAGQLQFGRIELEAERARSLELVGPPEWLGPATSITLLGAESWPTRQLGPTPTVDLAGLFAGAYCLQVAIPDRRELCEFHFELAALPAGRSELSLWPGSGELILDLARAPTGLGHQARILDQSQPIRRGWRVTVPPDAATGSLSGLPLGTHSVGVWPQSPGAAELAGEFTLTADEPRAEFAPYGLQRRLWLELLDADARPVPAAEVVLYRRQDQVVEARGRSGADGRIELATDCEQDLDLSLAAGVAGSSSGLRVEPEWFAATDQPIPIRLATGLGLRARVLGPSGPLAGVQVQVMDATQSLQLAPSVRTGPEGQVAFEGLSGSWVLLALDHPGYLRAGHWLEPAAEPRVHDVVLRPIGSLRLRVLDPEGAGAAGVALSVLDVALGVPLEALADWGIRATPGDWRTDAEGWLTVSGVGAGAFQVTARPTVADRTIEVSGAVELTAQLGAEAELVLRVPH
jgi:hypothetical protein